MYLNKLENIRLCSCTIATAVAKYLNSPSNEEINRKTLHILLDIGVGESFLDKNG